MRLPSMFTAESVFTAEAQRTQRSRGEEEREGDKGTRRQGVRETRRQGDKGTGRQGERLSPCLLFSLSPLLLVPSSPLLSSPLRFLRVLRASAVEKICLLEKLCLLLLLFSSWFVSPTANAQQTGEITGRVVAEDGGGLPNVSVEIYPLNTGQRNSGGRLSTTTDENGNFKFTGVSSRAYSIYVNEVRGYVNPFTSYSERNYYRIGDQAVITMIRGGVITGRVTTAEGEPMIGAQVSVMMTRDSEGNPVRRQYGSRQRWSDDRGVYRQYGLAPGTYVVVVRS